VAEAGLVNTQRTRTRDGTELLIRQVRPDDKRLIAEGMEHLSPESRYRRFFRPLDHLSQRDLVYLTEIDHTDHEALAAIDPESGDLVGVARYVRGAEPHLAEVSVVVGDPWQRRGVASALLERLAERAREERITHFVAPWSWTRTSRRSGCSSTGCQATRGRAEARRAISSC
jgi:GNAT superfamily N-acetyltransferase